MKAHFGDLLFRRRQPPSRCDLHTRGHVRLEMRSAGPYEGIVDHAPVASPASAQVAAPGPVREILNRLIEGEFDDLSVADVSRDGKEEHRARSKRSCQPAEVSDCATARRLPDRPASRCRQLRALRAPPRPPPDRVEQSTARLSQSSPEIVSPGASVVAATWRMAVEISPLSALVGSVRLRRTRRQNQSASIALVLSREKNSGTRNSPGRGCGSDSVSSRSTLIRLRRVRSSRRVTDSFRL